jgi:hypothetical protein
MAIHKNIQYAKIDELRLDPMNPRLGRSNTGQDVPQSEVLELMRDWTLEELALSFLDSGFWVQEALLVVEEELYGDTDLVVVEGNRRLAALMYLKRAFEDTPASRAWHDIVEGRELPETLFNEIPYLKADSRGDVDAFLGFRHVTGIKQWRPAEKAQYIAKLIEQNHMTYEDVMRKIGSKTRTVGQHYISYNLLLQMEEQEGISIKHVEDKFSVLYLSLRTAGVRKYLNIDITADPVTATKPVPKDRLEQLANFALWLFGDEKHPPLFTDSRQVDNFGLILESSEAIDYLERTESPKFEVAFRTAGGDEPELVRLIQGAADSIELVLGRAHHYKKSEKLQSAVKRLAKDVRQLTSLFPEVRDTLLEDRE